MNGRSGKNGKTPALRAFGILRGGHLAGWKLFQTVFLLAMCLLIAPANAMAANMQLTDQAGLLAEEDGKAIVRQIEKMESATGWDIMAVTTEDAGGMDAETYAETWFDDYTENDSGVICLIDMENREIAVKAFGECRYYVTDSRRDKILDAGYEEITGERYGQTLEAMLAEVETAFEEENPKKNSLYDKDTGKVTSYGEERRGISGMEMAIAAIAALAAGGVTAGSVIGRYRLKFGGCRYPMEKNGSVRLRAKEDRLVSQFVTHRHIPKKTSTGSGGGGGSSTVHTGAGGRSSSGGSRKF